jgi:carboxyl-terminal processing protease
MSSSSLRTALLALLSVVVAVALIFVGALLGVAVPEMDEAAQKVLGKDTATAVPDDGTGPEVSAGLQNEILQKLQGTYYKAVDSDSLAVSAIDGMLAGLKDPYTVYYSPKEFSDLKQETSGSYSGVGMVLMMNDRLPTVVSVFEGSPAAAEDIKAGDIILSVGGASTSGRTLDEVVSDIKGVEGSKVELTLYRPATPVTTTSTTVSQTEGNGESADGITTVDTTETLTIDLTDLPAGGSSKSYALTRRSIVIPTTKTEILDASGKKVAHVVLYTFNNMNTSQELRSVVESAITKDKVAAIVLDLRGNGGGLLDEAVKVASIFIKSGVIVSTEGLHSTEEELRASGNAVINVPLYVLIDKYSASASEIVAGALQDYGRATLVGETTFGKGLVQSIEPLSNGGAVKVTTAVYLTPKGRDINKTGISPDVLAPDDPATEAVDETVQKTLGLIASGPSAR